MSALFASLAALSYGAADYAGGKASRSHRVSGVLTVTQGVGLVGIALVAMLMGTPFASAPDLLWGAASGLSGVFGLSMLYSGLSSGAVAVVSPTAALVGTGLPVLVGILLGESPAAADWVGIGLAFPAILLLSLARGHERALDLRSLLFGLAAGVGFGGYYVLIGQTDPSSGFWPLASAKAASLLVIGTIGFLSTRRAGTAFLPRSRALVAAGIAGVLDMTANVFFLLAVRSGLLVTSAVISSLYPGPTVLLARLRDQERLGLRRVIGLLLSLAGVALISL